MKAFLVLLVIQTKFGIVLDPVHVVLANSKGEVLAHLSAELAGPGELYQFNEEIRRKYNFSLDDALFKIEEIGVSIPE